MKEVVLITIYMAMGVLAYSQVSAKKHYIEIKRMKFHPSELFVKKGDTVVWINKDFFPHDVASSNNKLWQSSPLEQGQSWSKIISKDEDYYCTLHVVMKGKIILKD